MTRSSLSRVSFATLGQKRPLFAAAENHKDVKKFRTGLIQIAI
jgi:hypothetical protein